MYRFSDILGQQHIKEHFQSAVVNKTINHAYIINGEKSSGKEMLAKTFAAAIMCEAGGSEPCLQCNTCKQVMDGRYTDIISFVKDKEKKTDIIDIGGIKEQIVNSMYVRPYNGDYKVYIIDDADKMNIPAQNAILKTLEEPPSYGVIILLTRNVERLLPTIISRCIVLNMRPVEDSVIKKYLREKLSVLDSQAEIIAAMAGGNVGRAKLLAEGGDFLKFKDDVVRILTSLPNGNIDTVLDGVNTLSKYKEDKVFSYDDVFELLAFFYRDVLLYKAEGDFDDLIFKDVASEISVQSGYFTYEALNKVIKLIDDARSKIASNVKYETVMELLFINIMEMSK